MTVLLPRAAWRPTRPRPRPRRHPAVGVAVRRVPRLRVPEFATLAQCASIARVLDERGDLAGYSAVLFDTWPSVVIAEGVGVERRVQLPGTSAGWLVLGVAGAGGLSPSAQLAAGAWVRRAWQGAWLMPGADVVAYSGAAAGVSRETVDGA